MPNRLRFSLPGNKESVPTVRLAIASYACSSGFSMVETEDISVAISEACKVICCHGHEDLVGRFLVVCGMEDDTMQITISDTNCGFTIQKGGCARCTNCPKDGEMSMFIISSLMDKAELTENSAGIKTLLMEKKKAARQL